MIRQGLNFWIGIFMLFAPLPLVAASAASTIPCPKLRLMMLNKTPSLQIVDVRPALEYAQGHIQGAQNVPSAAIQAADLPHDGPIVVYCSEGACPLSNDSAAALLARGYQDVSVLEGGLIEWRQLGYPVEKTPPPAAPPPIKQRTAKQAASLISKGKLLALDARPREEFAAGHLPGAVNIPLENLANGLVGLPKGRELLVYDRVSSRSKQAARQLVAAGLTVSELSGGVSTWAAKGRALEVK